MTTTVHARVTLDVALALIGIVRTRPGPRRPWRSGSHARPVQHRWLSLLSDLAWMVTRPVQPLVDNTRRTWVTGGFVLFAIFAASTLRWPT